MTVLLGVPLFIPLYLAVETTSQFLTADASYLINITVDPETYGYKQWMYGNLRTTNLILTPLAQILQSFFQIGETELKMMLKLGHWLLGLGATLWLHHVIDGYFVDSKDKKVFFLLFFFSVFLLPGSIFLFKVYNYDILSMLLGCISVFYIWASLKEKRFAPALFALIAAWLGSQEKLSISPILILTIPLCTWTIVRSMPRYKYIWITPLTLLFLALAAVLCVIPFIGLLAVTDWKLPGSSYIWAVFEPLKSWVRPFVRFQFQGASKLLWSTKVLLISHAVNFVFCVLLAYALCIWERFLVPRFLLFRKANAWTWRLVLLLLTGGLCAALVGIYVNDPYWFPLRPIPEGFYHPAKVGWVIHFGAVNRISHLFRLTAHNYAHLFCSFPTVITAGLFFFLIRGSVQKDRDSLTLNPLWMFILLLVPFLWSLPEIYGSKRLYSVFTLMITLLFCLMPAPWLSRMTPTRKWTVTVLFLLFMTVQAVPFRPVGASFMPFWAWDRYALDAPVGHRSVSWPGWGEEAMLAGKWLKEQCNEPPEGILEDEPCEELRFWIRYPDQWMDPSSVFTLHYTKWLESDSHPPLTKRDYYLFSRLALMQRRLIFPSIEPVHVVSHRGYAIAWLYRGDQLKAAGYSNVVPDKKDK